MIQPIGQILLDYYRYILVIRVISRDTILCAAFPPQIGSLLRNIPTEHVKHPF